MVQNKGVRPSKTATRGIGYQTMADRVYQFKITLLEISPKIWRRIQVPEKYSFWDLHVAIQDAMGWQDKHLHLFKIKRKRAHKHAHIGIPDDEMFDDEPKVQPSWEMGIRTHFNDLGIEAIYEYDFGDGWIHKILLEGYMVKKRGIKYPHCIGGKRACPPEDCGGVFGYHQLLEILSDKKHSDYQEMVNWLGGEYNPEFFDPEIVRFDNPKKRWRMAFLDPSL